MRQRIEADRKSGVRTPTGGGISARKEVYMKQLTIGDILTLVSDLKTTTDLTDKEINELPVYIGNDEELNGIHTAYRCEHIACDKAEDSEYIDMIDKAILIS